MPRNSSLARQQGSERLLRPLALLGVLLICGCGPAGDAATPRPGGDHEHVVDPSPAASAFRLDEARQVILLDTQIAPGQQRRFDLGLGSITLETLHVIDHKLTFRYTPEVEGGYTVYECTAPVSSTPVEIEIAPDGTPGATSFDLAACRVIRQGSVHFAP